MLLVLALLFQTDSVVLENPYVRVTRGYAACPTDEPRCERVVVALGDMAFRAPTAAGTMKRGDVRVLRPGDQFAVKGDNFFTVVLKTAHPPLHKPAESIPPAKNAILFEDDRLLIFEERLAVGDTRERHSHNQRVVIQLNRTKLQQWPDGQAEVIRDIEPDRPAFNESVIHKVKNVGDQPLRGVVIEIKK